MDKWYAIAENTPGLFTLQLTDWAVEVDLNGDLLDIASYIDGIHSAFNLYELLPHGFMILYDEAQVTGAAVLETVDRIIAQIEAEIAE